MRDAASILVAVKSTDTAAMADLIARHAPLDATIVSLQNGVDNVPLLRERLSDRKVLAGMVAFNVVTMGRRPLPSRDLRRSRHRAGRIRHGVAARTCRGWQ